MLPQSHTITAGARTDLFVDPADGTSTLNAPSLLIPVDGPFRLSAKVRVEFGATYDAGALLVWVDPKTWAKLCFEYSPQGQPMVVSVVTRGHSDDANGFTVDGDTVWLRVSYNGASFAFHASTDGSWWQLVRHFRLTEPSARGITVGLEGQSPTGQSCTVHFSGVRLVPEALAELRDGS